MTFMVVQTTLTALGEMFEAARSIMSWLGDCAKVTVFFLSFFNLYESSLVTDFNFVFFLRQIIASENQPVRWTTPLGLPLVQPYRRVGRHLVSIFVFVSLINSKYSNPNMKFEFLKIFRLKLHFRF